jgi:hypothetical protein
LAAHSNTIGDGSSAAGGVRSLAFARQMNHESYFAMLMILT